MLFYQNKTYVDKTPDQFFLVKEGSRSTAESNNGQGGARSLKRNEKM